MFKRLYVFKNIKNVKFTGVLIGLISLEAFHSPEKNRFAPGYLSEKTDEIKKITTLESRTLISADSDSTKILLNHTSFKDFSKGKTFLYNLNLNSFNSGNGPIISGVKMETATSSKN